MDPFLQTSAELSALLTRLSEQLKANTRALQVANELIQFATGYSSAERLQADGKVKLKIMDGISDTYRVRGEIYRSLLNEFSNIIYPTLARSKRDQY